VGNHPEDETVIPILDECAQAGLANGLSTLLEILESRAAAVLADDLVLNADDEIQNGSSLDVFQSIQGG
jgi:sulfur carrier protein ThiS